MDEPRRLPGMTQDAFMPDPGTEDRVACGVCGTEMRVVRDCHGPTSYVMAMGHSSRAHDFFYCPHRSDAWHKQVVALREEQSRTASVKVVAILEEEVVQILEQKEPTKEGPWSYDG